jgi:hypothetical protein
MTYNKLPCFGRNILCFVLVKRSIFQVFFHHGTAPRHHSNRPCSEVDQGLHSGKKIFTSLTETYLIQFDINLPNLIYAH